MAIQPVPNYTPVPTPVIQRGDRATFAPRVDTFLSWLAGAPPQFKALADVTHNNAGEALAQATAAGTHAGNAEGYATAAQGYAVVALGYRDAASDYAATAMGYRDAAQGFRDTALAHRDAAEGFKNQAAASALALTATSTSSVVIGNGAKAFTIAAGKQFTPGVDLKIADASNTANAMYGTVTSYSGTNLVVNVTSTTGGGTIANWNISLSGQRGAQGVPGPTGTLAGASEVTLAGPYPTIFYDETDGKLWRQSADLGFIRYDVNQAGARDFTAYKTVISFKENAVDVGTALNETKGPDIAADGASVLDLREAGGNFFSCIGAPTGSINRVRVPGGAERSVLFTVGGAGKTLVHVDGQLHLPGGANIVTQQGDIAVFRGFNDTITLVESYTRANGRAVVAPVGLSLLASITPTAGAAVLDFLNVFTSTYDDYLIMFDGLRPVESETTLLVRFAAGGVADASTAYGSVGGGAGGTTANATSAGIASGTTETGRGATGQMVLQNMNSADQMKIIISSSMSQGSGSNPYQVLQAISTWVGAAAATGFRLYFNGGATFQGQGRVRVYGYEK